jgi:hypothetical protein
MKSKKVTSNTIFISNNDYEKELIASGGHLKHEFTHDTSKIVLPDGLMFEKNFKQVFPVEFTEWISGFFQFKLCEFNIFYNSFKRCQHGI